MEINRYRMNPTLPPVTFRPFFVGACRCVGAWQMEVELSQFTLYKKGVQVRIKTGQRDVLRAQGKPWT